MIIENKPKKKNIINSIASITLIKHTKRTKPTGRTYKGKETKKLLNEFAIYLYTHTYIIIHVLEDV